MAPLSASGAPSPVPGSAGVGVGRIPACLLEGRSASRFGSSRLPPSARSRAPAHVTGAPVIPPLPLRLLPACAALNVSSVRDRSRRRRPGLRTGRTPDSAVTRLPDRRVLLPPLGALGGPAVRGVRLLSGRSGCGPGSASLRFPRVPAARWLPPLPRRPRPSSSPGFPGVFPSRSERRLRNRRASPAGKGRIERGRARGAFPGSGPRLWPARSSGCSGPR